MKVAGRLNTLLIPKIGLSWDIIIDNMDLTDMQKNLEDLFMERFMFVDVENGLRNSCVKDIKHHPQRRG